MTILNLILEKQRAIIENNCGVIDKFVADEVVAVFSGDEAPQRACDAALQIVRLCEETSEEFDGLTVGIGVAAGSVIHGMIGSIRRADYTVIGDSVNLASRLCGIAKGMQIVVSDATKREVKVGFLFKGPYSVRLKGKNKPQRVWLLTGTAQGRPS